MSGVSSGAARVAASLARQKRLCPVARWSLIEEEANRNVRFQESYVLLPDSAALLPIVLGKFFARVQALMVKRARATILVVDDDPAIRDVLHLMLDDEYEVLEAADGAQALATLASRKINLILLDLLMAGTDGFEVIEQRRAEDKAVPFIVLSALDTASTAATAMRLGAVDYVTKPFDEEALRCLIGETLTSPAGQRGLARAQSIRRPVVLFVGLDLGLYASVTVLLRQQCRVARAENVFDALTSSSTLSASVLVVDLASLGPRGAEAIAGLRAYLPLAEFVAIATGSPHGIASVPCTVLEGPARVTDLLAAIHGHAGTSGAGAHRYSSRVASILDHLGAHFAEASVRRLSRELGASTDHLAALFREEVGLPLKVYMTELRVEAAKWLLLEAGEKLETVAVGVGLHDASHLSKLFVQYAGIRPGAYRRRGVPTP